MDSIDPHFKGGKKSVLNDEEKTEILKWVSEHAPTSREVKDYVINCYGVRFTTTHIQRVLKGMGMVHEKITNHGYMRWYDKNRVELSKMKR